MQKMLTAPIDPPSTYAPDARPLDAVVMRGLERDPSRRWPSAKEMGAALERCVGLASPSEVAEWVEGLARPALVARADRVAEIESSSERIFVLPPEGVTDEALTEPDAAAGIGPDNKGAFPPQTAQTAPPFASDAFPSRPAAAGLVDPVSQRSQLSSISVSRTGRPPPERRTTLFVAIGAAAFLLLVLVAVVGKVIARGSTATSLAPSTAPKAIDSATMAPATTAAATTTPTTITAPLAATSTSVKPVVPQTTVHAPATTARPTASPTTSAAQPPRTGCDPPYAIDADGHKKWKPECIN
jgi:serine/threonine-protein kinase